MRTIPIDGSDIETISPVNGVLYVAGIIRTPLDKICINWEVDGASGTTICEAWRGQYEIDCFIRAGYRILSVEKEE